jgi:hypothetical protein
MSRLRVVGWGPFRWWWEKSREQRALDQARHTLDMVNRIR